MAEIGKSLVFYFHYYPEMQRLYEEREMFPEIEQRLDRDLIVKKVEDVGRAAGAEAADPRRMGCPRRSAAALSDYSYTSC